MQLLFSVVCVVLFLLSGEVDHSLLRAPWFGGASRRMFVHGVGLSANANGHVGKKGPSYAADYGAIDPSDSRASCGRESDFEINENYIIRTKDSEKNGATFVSALQVRTFDTCIEQCCLKEKCDTTIFVQMDAYDQGSDQPNCFLFECRPQGETGPNLCLFTDHPGYISSIKKNHGGFQSPILPKTTQQMEARLSTTTQAPPVPDYGGGDLDPFSSCGEGYFECASGECINARYVCNDIYDCKDHSDEYGCEVPPLSNPNQQDNVEEAPAVLEETDNQGEMGVVTVVAPIQMNDTTPVEPVKTIDTNQPEANLALDTDLIESGGGGGMPPASSAILPLVIGLIITMFLLMMVGCRLRYMNQRLRYGRLKTNAQDADYLINGMYL